MPYRAELNLDSNSNGSKSQYSDTNISEVIRSVSVIAHIEKPDIDIKQLFYKDDPPGEDSTCNTVVQIVAENINESEINDDDQEVEERKIDKESENNTTTDESNLNTLDYNINTETTETVESIGSIDHVTKTFEEISDDERLNHLVKNDENESINNSYSINEISSIESDLTANNTVKTSILEVPEISIQNVTKSLPRSPIQRMSSPQSRGFTPNPVHQKTTEIFIKDVVEFHKDINIVKPMSHERARHFQKTSLNYPKLKPPSPDRTPLPPRVGMALQMPVLLVQDDPRLRIDGETNIAVQYKLKNQSNHSLNGSKSNINSIDNKVSISDVKDYRDMRKTIIPEKNNPNEEEYQEFDDTVSELSDFESIDIDNVSIHNVKSLEQIVRRQASRHDVVLREMTQRYNIKRIRDKITKLEGLPLPTSLSDMNSISNESLESYNTTEGINKFKLDKNLGNNLNLELKLLREFQYAKLHHLQGKFDDNSSFGGNSTVGPNSSVAGNTIISYITNKTGNSLRTHESTCHMSKNEKLTLQKYYPFDQQDCVYAIKKQKDIKGQFNNFVKTRYLPPLVGRYGSSELLIKKLDKKNIIHTKGRNRKNIRTLTNES